MTAIDSSSGTRPPGPSDEQTEQESLPFTLLSLGVISAAAAPLSSVFAERVLHQGSYLHLVLASLGALSSGSYLATRRKRSLRASALGWFAFVGSLLWLVGVISFAVFFSSMMSDFR